MVARSSEFLRKPGTTAGARAGRGSPPALLRSNGANSRAAKMEWAAPSSYHPPGAASRKGPGAARPRAAVQPREGEGRRPQSRCVAPARPGRWKPPAWAAEARPGEPLCALPCRGEARDSNPACTTGLAKRPALLATVRAKGASVALGGGQLPHVPGLPLAEAAPSPWAAGALGQEKTLLFCARPPAWTGAAQTRLGLAYAERLAEIPQTKRRGAGKNRPSPPLPSPELRGEPPCSARPRGASAESPSSGRRRKPRSPERWGGLGEVTTGLAARTLCPSSVT